MDSQKTDATPSGADILEQFEKMAIEIRGIRRELAELRAELPVSDTMTVTDIAKKLGVSVATLTAKPWNLPNHGKPDIGYSPRRWLRERVATWYAIPEQDRKEAYDNLPPEERANA